MESIVKELIERREYDENAVREIRDQAGTDMQYVGGNPWTSDDEEARKNRPTIAPDEMSQYFNQVINALRANPRGVKFAPTGNGANDKGATWYQDKMRETEYRSNAENAYLTAAENAIQRSYGFVRVSTRYQSPRSSNQELWIEAVPDPDMILIDADAKMPDSSDMGHAFVMEWANKDEVNRKREKYKSNQDGKSGAAGKDSYSTMPLPTGWSNGRQDLLVEYWNIETKPRKLLLIQARGQQPMEVFEDELKGHSGFTVIRDLRTVDYPKVRMYLSDGRDILHEQDWLGKYIPIVSCYGKILYVPEGGEVKKKILSMTRFMRAPWKAYAYACSQQLEVLGQVPKATVVAYAGQLDRFKQDWEESSHVPKAWLYADGYTAETGEQLLPLPQLKEYVGGQHLQAIELVKEGFRRAIQSAAGSNFMPTQAQRHNEKSGIALQKIDQAASQGTFHFVYSYNGLIRQAGIICEDLFDKIYDYQGETGTMKADGQAVSTPINNPSDPKAVSTKGDYLVTVSTSPSSDSERTAAGEFTDTLVQNIQMIAGICTNDIARAILARSIKMKTLGPIGDSIADLIEPESMKTQDGEPPNPEVMALKGKLQQATQAIQQAEQEKQGKVVEQQGKMATVQAQGQTSMQIAQMNNETKIAVAELGAKVERLSLFLEERARVGVQTHEAASDAAKAAHEMRMTGVGHAHEVALAAADAAHQEQQTAAQTALSERQAGRTAAQQAEASDTAAQQQESGV